MSGLPESGPG
jgi:hypothetical protein